MHKIEEDIIHHSGSTGVQKILMLLTHLQRSAIRDETAVGCCHNVYNTCLFEFEAMFDWDFCMKCVS